MIFLVFIFKAENFCIQTFTKVKIKIFLSNFDVVKMEILKKKLI